MSELRGIEWIDDRIKFHRTIISRVGYWFDGPTTIEEAIKKIDELGP